MVFSINIMTVNPSKGFKMLELVFAIAALVAVKHFCRTAPRSFSQNELPEIHQSAMSRSEYRAQARRYP